MRKVQVESKQVNGNLRKVHNTADKFRSATRDWESALAAYIAALRELNKKIPAKRAAR
jgi:hypothetical protein